MKVSIFRADLVMLLAKKINAVDAHSPFPLSSEMQQTLASLRLEELTPNEASMDDIRLFDAGEMTKEEFLSRALARPKHNQVDLYLSRYHSFN